MHVIHTFLGDMKVYLIYYFVQTLFSTRIDIREIIGFVDHLKF